MSQSTPTTPLIIPPSPRAPGLPSDVSRAETLTESDGQQGSTEEPAEATEVMERSDIPNGHPSQATPVVGTETKEQEINTLKDMVKKLQEELSQTQQQCTTLQERERALQQALEGETGKSADDSRPNRVDGVVTPTLNVSDKYKC